VTKKAKNSPIGEVECPHKGCTEVCKVYRFRQRTEGRTSVFSGKHYAECPVHGRIGSDGNQASTDYILEHGKIWGAKDQAGAGPEKTAKNPAGSPASAPAPSRKSPAQSQPPKPEPTRSTWRPLID
jgi:hypothetical protein